MLKKKIKPKVKSKSNHENKQEQIEKINTWVSLKVIFQFFFPQKLKPIQGTQE